MHLLGMITRNLSPERGRKVCWKIVKDSQEFLNACCSLGSADGNDENTCAEISFVSCMVKTAILS